MEIIENINQFAGALDNPTAKVLFSIIFVFAIKWSLSRNDPKIDNKTYSFWDDQKDEIVVTLIAGFGFLVFDDDILNLVAYVQSIINGTEYIHEERVFHSFYYLLVSPAVERGYFWYRKFKK